MQTYRRISSVEELLKASEQELSEIDIGWFNLRTATNLPGSEGLDVEARCRQLDDWAEKVLRGTDELEPVFEARPEEFEHSFAQFRIAAMITVLQRDLGVHYNPECMTGPYDATDSRNQFIHGLLSGHGGTCVSMPVLYAAIGRRLGYPLKFRYAKTHVYLRWDDPSGEQFNVEATQRGYAPHSEDYYVTWPFLITPEELQEGHYLTNLTARQETALCFAQRGHVLLDNFKCGRATAAFNCATDLDESFKDCWAINSIIQDILKKLWNGGLPRSCTSPEVIDRLAPTEYIEKWPHWGKRITDSAKEHLIRIFTLRDQRRPKELSLVTNEGVNLWFTIQL